MYYESILKLISEKEKGLAVLIDPDKFDVSQTSVFLKQIPKQTTHLFVGGSTAGFNDTKATVKSFKAHTNLPVFLFPGDHSQITAEADAILFLSLLSGRNAEYLVGQQVKSISKLRTSNLEIISTGYILLDGGNPSTVARVSKTMPISQDDIETIIHTALAGQYMGAKLIYLEAGSGAAFPVKPFVIKAVKRVLAIPLIVGGGIKNDIQKQVAYEAGADLVVMGSVFEDLKN
jgi:putative glycerol-1-phosphate prenyltransferase